MLVHAQGSLLLLRFTGTHNHGRVTTMQAMVASSLEEVQRGGDYESAFPNVGLVLWQAGFVLAEWLIRLPPAFVSRRGGGWAGVRVLELGCGVGQLATCCGTPQAGWRFAVCVPAAPAAALLPPTTSS